VSRRAARRDPSDQTARGRQGRRLEIDLLAFDVEGLTADAPIGWGWMDAPEKERRRTKFSYQVPG
jgi:hypothetical protein